MKFLNSETFRYLLMAEGGDDKGGSGGGANDQGGDAGGDKGDVGGDSLLELNKDSGQGAGTKYTPGVKPEGLDDSLWDAEAKTFKADALFEKLTGAEKIAKDLREKMGRKGAPPEKADDYKFDLDDVPFKDALKADDPVLKKAKEVAHKLGIPQSQFGPLVKEVLGAAYEAMGQESEITEPTAEEKEAFRNAEIEKIGPNGPAVIRAVSEFVRQNIGVHFDERSVETVKALTSTADGIHFMNQMREMLGGERLNMAALDGAAITGLPSDAEIFAFMKTPEFEKGDPTAHAKYDNWLTMRTKAGRPTALQV